MFALDSVGLTIYIYIYIYIYIKRIVWAWASLTPWPQCQSRLSWGVPQTGETVYLWTVSSLPVDETSEDGETPPEEHVLPKQLALAIERELSRHRRWQQERQKELANLEQQKVTCCKANTQSLIDQKKKLLAEATMATVVFHQKSGKEA